MTWVSSVRDRVAERPRHEVLGFLARMRTFKKAWTRACLLYLITPTFLGCIIAEQARASVQTDLMLSVTASNAWGARLSMFEAEDLNPGETIYIIIPFKNFHLDESYDVHAVQKVDNEGQSIVSVLVPDVSSGIMLRGTFAPAHIDDVFGLRQTDNFIAVSDVADGAKKISVRYTGSSRTGSVALIEDAARVVDVDQVKLQFPVNAVFLQISNEFEHRFREQGETDNRGTLKIVSKPDRGEAVFRTVVWQPPDNRVVVSLLIWAAVAFLAFSPNLVGLEDSVTKWIYAAQFVAFASVVSYAYLQDAVSDYYLELLPVFVSAVGVAIAAGRIFWRQGDEAHAVPETGAG